MRRPWATRCCPAGVRPRKRGSAVDQGELDGVAVGAVDVVAVLHGSTGVVEGSAGHGHQRGAAALAEQSCLAGIGASGADALVGDPQLYANLAQHRVQAPSRQVGAVEVDHVDGQEVVHQGKGLVAHVPQPFQ